jgi:hypothetical protein
MRKILFFALMALTLGACQKEAVQPKVNGRYVPERKDDFAWENEYAAYRFYGPALAPENPSNGVDIFMKNTPVFVLDTFFYNYVNYKIPYHVQHGIGFDGYKVAHTTGCGGPAVIVNDSLYVGNQYDTWEILEQTPEKFVFRLHYDTLSVAGCAYSEDITVTATAGTMLNKAELVLTPLGDQPAAELFVGAGLYLHDSIGTYNFLPAGDAVVYTETALSDPGAVRLNKKWYDNTELGQTHEAIIVPGATKELILSNTIVMAVPYTPGETLTYWFGGCWSGWTDGERSFPTQEEWIEAIQEEIKKL